jgi:hypothetical protein
MLKLDYASSEFRPYLLPAEATETMPGRLARVNVG